MSKIRIVLRIPVEAIHEIEVGKIYDLVLPPPGSGRSYWIRGATGVPVRVHPREVEFLTEENSDA